MNAKNIITSLLILCSVALAYKPAIAQSKARPNWVSLYIGVNETNHSPSKTVFHHDFSTNINTGIEYDRYLNPSFDIAASLFFNSYLSASYNAGATLMTKNGGSNRNSGATKLGVNANFFLKYKLANGYLLPAWIPAHPYIFTGLGAANKNSRNVNTNAAEKVQIPFGAGLDIRLADSMYLTFRTTFDRAINTNLKDIEEQRLTSRYVLGFKFSLR